MPKAGRYYHGKQINHCSKYNIILESNNFISAVHDVGTKFVSIVIGMQWFRVR